MLVSIINNKLFVNKLYLSSITKDDYELQRKELALQFYITLQNIINRDPDCKDCCDFIFFDGKIKKKGLILRHLFIY